MRQEVVITKPDGLFTANNDLEGRLQEAKGEIQLVKTEKIAMGEKTKAK